MSPLVDMHRSTTPTATPEEVDRIRLRYGFWIIITGFALVFLITVISTFRWAEVTSVATVVGRIEIVHRLVGEADWFSAVGAHYVDLVIAVPFSDKRYVSAVC